MPKVAMGEPLIAQRLEQSCMFLKLVKDGGMILTSALMSLRYQQWEVTFVRSSILLVGQDRSSPLATGLTIS